MLGQALPVLRYKNRGTVYHVTRSKTTRSILELTAHVMSFAVRAFASREEAMQVIDHMILQEDLTQDWCWEKVGCRIMLVGIFRCGF